MGLLREMYFSAEAYKIALDINEHIKKVQRSLIESGGNGNCYISSEVNLAKQKLDTLSRKASECNPARVMYIKVCTPNGYEVPVLQYIADITSTINEIKTLL